MKNFLFHIAETQLWNPALETYTPAGFESEGFIHCSTALQIEGVAKRLFCGRHDLVLLCIDPEGIDDPILFENLEGGNELFPHLYGPLYTRDVVSSAPISVDNRGVFDMPPVMQACIQASEKDGMGE